MLDLKDKRLLLVGCCGFIGQNFTELLSTKGYNNFVVMDKMSYCSSDEICNKYSIPLVKVDINDPKADEFIQFYKPDVIINFAANSHVDNSIKDPDSFRRDNVDGNLALLNSIRKLSKFDLFCLISTDEVLGDKLTGFSVEDDPRLCSSPYSASKGCQELFTEAYGRTYGIPYIITRSSNNYGPFQHQEKLIPKAISNILLSDGLCKTGVYGNGLQERDWIFCPDNCEGILTAIEKGTPGNIYHIGGEDILTNVEILTMIAKLLGKSFDECFCFVEDRLGHDTRYAIDCSKLKSLGWAPKTSLEDGLQQTIDWYKKRLN